MSKNYDSLLEYKKSTKDWHYNPSVKSIDCQYVGRIKNLEFLNVKSEIKEKQSESSVKLYEEDFVNGKTIPDKLSPNSIAASKLDHIKHGYKDCNSEYYQWIDTREEMPKFFEKVKKLTKLDSATVACFKQEPGNTNPWHFDSYASAIKKYGLSENERDKIVRYLIFLEDWDWGHIIQIGNNVLSQWKKGDIYTWKYGMYHLSSNAGITPKWTCQVTGLINKKSLHLNSEKEFTL